MKTAKRARFHAVVRPDLFGVTLAMMMIHLWSFRDFRGEYYWTYDTLGG